MEEDWRGREGSEGRGRKSILQATMYSSMCPCYLTPKKSSRSGILHHNKSAAHVTWWHATFATKKLRVVTGSFDNTLFYSFYRFSGGASTSILLSIDHSARSLAFSDHATDNTRSERADTVYLRLRTADVVSTRACLSLDPMARVLVSATSL